MPSGLTLDSGTLVTKIIHSLVLCPVADPGFPVGGGGAPTSDVGSFRQKCMRKRKNWVGGAHWRRPLDPPVVSYFRIVLVTVVEPMTFMEFTDSTVKTDSKN